MNQFTMPPITPVPFNGIMAFAWISVFLIIGMLLRATFPMFRKYLIPACIIGGVVGFIFQNLGLLSATGFPLNPKILQLIVFHLFNLTWIYIGLRVPLPAKAGAVSATRNIFWFAGVSALIMTVAMLVGTITTTITNFLGLSTGPDSLGILTALGFVQGPGQALTIAKIWGNETSFTGLADFALGASAMGFVIAIVVGIFLMNIIARKMGLEKITNPSPSEECGYYGECDEIKDAGKITTSPSNIDVFAWHIALGLGSYFLALIVIVAASLLVPKSFAPLLWSLFFLICSCSAISVRLFIAKIGKRHLLCNGVTSRISNTLVDFLVCGTFISVQLGNISQYMWAYIISCTMMTLTIGGFCWFYCRKLKDDAAETFAYKFGGYTGTVSTGLVLLRMIDPQGKSQVPVRSAIANSLLLPVTLISIPLKHLEVVYQRPVWMVIALFTLLSIIYATFVHFVKIPKNKKAWQRPESE